MSPEHDITLRIDFSGTPHPQQRVDIRRAFDGFHMHELGIKYSVGNNHGEPESSNELVITNWSPEALGQLF